MKPTLTQPTPRHRKHTAPPCHRCGGWRTITRMESKWWGGSRSGVAIHGHKVPKAYLCDACNGTGKAAA